MWSGNDREFSVDCGTGVGGRVGGGEGGGGFRGFACAGVLLREAGHVPSSSARILTCSNI